MGKSLDVIANLKSDSAVDVDLVGEIIFIDKLLGNVGQLNADVFRPVKGGGWR